MGSFGFAASGSAGQVTIAHSGSAPSFGSRYFADSIVRAFESAGHSAAGTSQCWLLGSVGRGCTSYRLPFGFHPSGSASTAAAGGSSQIRIRIANFGRWAGLGLVATARNAAAAIAVGGAGSASFAAD